MLGYPRRLVPVAAAAALMALSALLRTGAFDGVGDYSDISLLYDRDRLEENEVPYFDYRLEYPVGIGAFQWLANVLTPDRSLYFAASVALLSLLAAATAWLLVRLPASRPWVFAAAPAVAFWGVQNWDFAALFPLAAALVLHARGRDVLGAAALAIAVSTKLFPVVVLPVILAVRLAQGRRRRAGVIAAAFALITVVLNAPVALDLSGGGIAVRHEWLHFFELNRDRPPLDTLWSAIFGFGPVSQINLASAVLAALGVGTLLAGTVRSARNGAPVLLPAAGAALLWIFATNKVYSLQFALWILFALAIVRVPIWAAFAFWAIDVLLFVRFWDGPEWLGSLVPEARHVATILFAAYATCLVWRARPALPARGAHAGHD